MYASVASWTSSVTGVNGGTPLASSVSIAIVLSSVGSLDEAIMEERGGRNAGLGDSISGTRLEGSYVSPSMTSLRGIGVC